MIAKYRAKRVNDGEWVCGTYISYAFGAKGCHYIDHDIMRDGLDLREMSFVEPDTLSRCSGLTACGQDVYEGDIVRFHIDHTTEFWTAVVRFGWHDTYEYGWYLEPIRDTVFTKRIGAWLGENAAFGSTAAVIGNVWDNPELMKVKT